MYRWKEAKSGKKIHPVFFFFYARSLLSLFRNMLIFIRCVFQESFSSLMTLSEFNGFWHIKTRIWGHISQGGIFNINISTTSTNSGQKGLESMKGYLEKEEKLFGENNNWIHLFSKWKSNKMYSWGKWVSFTFSISFENFVFFSDEYSSENKFSVKQTLHTHRTRKREGECVRESVSGVCVWKCMCVCVRACVYVCVCERVTERERGEREREIEPLIYIYIYTPIKAWGCF